MTKVVKLNHDEEAECPMDNDGAWTLYSFSRRHSHYKDPETLGLGSSLEADGLPKVLNPGLRTKLRVGLAHFLSYYEHGRCLWFRKESDVPGGVEFRWDGVRVAGLLVWEHEADHMGAKSYADRAKDADGFLTEYTAWCNGDGLAFSIEDENGETVDSCGGFLDPDYFVAEVADMLDDDDFTVEGDADGLEDDLRRAVAKRLAAKAEVPPAP